MHTQIMKLRYIFATIATALCVLATSCKPEGPSYLSEVKVDSSWITLPADGGSKVITVNATDNWEIVDLPSWLTAAPMAGKAGETKVTFSAANAETHPDEIEKTFYIKSNGKKVGIKVVQGAAFTIANTPETAYTPEEAIAIYLAGKDLGTQVYVKGVVKSAAIDLAYGNAEFYLEENNDDYSFEFYRCLDFGGEKFTNDKKVKKGDVITAYGSLGIYKETIELLQGCVLISIEAPTGDNVEVVNEDELVAGKDGGNIVAKVIAQGGPLCVNTEAQDWISVSKTEIVDGVNLVTLAIAPNNGGARQGVISFSAGTKSVDANVSQAGNIAEVSVAEFLAAEVSGSAQYKISGFITDRTDISGHKFDLEQYGNFDITDATGNAYIYGVGAKGDIAKYGVKEGDIITLVGLRADYKGSAQMGSGQYESHKSVTPVTAAEAAALADDDKNDPANYIRLTGKVAKPSAESGNKFDLETYGNFDLVDESGSIYVYGVSTGWNGETKKFGTLGVKEGDIITIVAYKTSYKEKAQVVGMYVSHEEGQGEMTDDQAYEVFAINYEPLQILSYQIPARTYNDEDNMAKNADVCDKYWEIGDPIVKAIEALPNKAEEYYGEHTLAANLQSLLGEIADLTQQLNDLEAAFNQEMNGESADKFKTTVTVTPIENAYTDGVATVNGIENVYTVKTGTSSKSGSFSVALPTGTKKFSFYCVMWKGNEGAVTIKFNGEVVEPNYRPHANDGAAGNAPYTITCTDDDFVEFDFESLLGGALAEESTLEFSSDKRCIYFGLQAE